VSATPETILAILERVADPEIPVLNIVEMGIVRDVSVDGTRVRVDVTPTYSGCPALHAIREAIVAALEENGMPGAEVRTVYSPAWSTDGWSAETRQKLKRYGIAPPEDKATFGGESPLPFAVRRAPVACPFCNSTDTELKSAFGSTACKALHYCHACRQPFEHFKCH
jgi:ring-1,2-phenylacetyl-CoA epoxidase subunit PaaD